MIKQALTILNENRETYRKHWTSYHILTILTSIIGVSIGMFVCGKLASLVMKLFGIPYISSSTLMMLVKNPLALILLLVILALLVMFVYFQYMVTINGIRDIHNEQYSFLHVLKYSFKQLFQTKLADIPLIVLYIALILPLSGIGYDTTVFSKVALPTFIVNTCLNKITLAIPLIILVVFLVYLGIKYLYVMPLNVLDHKSMKEAFKESARRMHKKKLSMLFFLIIMGIYLLVIDFIFLGSGLLIQYLVDRFIPQIGQYTVFVIASILRIIYLYIKARYIVITMLAVTPRESLKPDPNIEPVVIKKHSKFLTRVLPYSLICLYCIGMCGIYLYSFTNYKPLIISHRGVDGANGVQNTIPALIATIESSHPDYVEMDIQETKDLKFVVLHDSSPYALTGDKGSTHDYTLDELTKMVAKENGFEANLCSFDDYLDEAEARNQKLLIEIKPHAGDSPDMLDRFITQYGQRIVEKGHMVQSMNLGVVQELVGSKDKQRLYFGGTPIETACIIEFNILYPETKAKIYTMEETTIDENIMTDAFLRGDKIFAWTINSIDSMRNMIIQNVNGIITDYPSMMEEEIASLHDGTYTEVLYLYMKTLYT